MSIENLCLLLLVFTLAACSKKIDGSSTAAFNKSLIEMTEGMTREERYAFGKTLGEAAAMKLQYTPGERAVAMNLNPNFLAEKIREAVDGLTVKDLQKLAAQNQKREQQIVLAEIDEKLSNIENEVARVTAGIEGLKKVSFQNVRYTLQDAGSATYNQSPPEFDVGVAADFVNASNMKFVGSVGVELILDYRKHDITVELPSDGVEPGTKVNVTFVLRRAFRGLPSSFTAKIAGKNEPLLSVVGTSLTGSRMRTEAEWESYLSWPRKEIRDLTAQREEASKEGYVHDPEPWKKEVSAESKSVQSEALENAAEIGPKMEPVAVLEVQADQVETVGGLVKIVSSNQSTDGISHLTINDKRINDIGDDHVTLLTRYRYTDRDILLVTHGCSGSGCSFTSIALINIQANGEVKVDKHDDLTINTDGGVPSVHVNDKGSLSLSFSGQTAPQRWTFENGKLFR